MIARAGTRRLWNDWWNLYFPKKAPMNMLTTCPSNEAFMPDPQPVLSYQVGLH